MQVQVQSTRFTAGEDLISLLEKKLGKLDKIFERIEKCSVMLKLEKNDVKNKCVIEARLVIPGKDLFAQERAETFEKAIDPLANELKQQLLRYKDRLLERR
jgi:putative sigma-54 modulation protein